MASKFSLDANCLISLLTAWDPHHERVVKAYEAHLARKEDLVISGHALTECFSVLTRLPPPRRISPEMALTQLTHSFGRSAQIASLPPRAFWDLIEDMARRGLGGGRVHDAMVALSSRLGGATMLLTFNVKHFVDIAPPGLDVREP